MRDVKAATGIATPAETVVFPFLPGMLGVSITLTSRSSLLFGTSLVTLRCIPVDSVCLNDFD